MITISAFADEIGPDLKLQMDTCQAQGVRCIDVRNIDDINVSKMTVQQAAGYKKQMDDRGFKVPCIGSPLGKIRINEDFPSHLELLKHCCDVAGAFGTNLIRVFSFYGPEGGDIQKHRAEVMDRLTKMVKVAQSAGMILMMENEKAIYGAKPEGMKDIFATIQSPALQGVFDPANYVEEGVRPYDDGWKKGLDRITHYFHVKDKDPKADVCVPAGQGEGQFRELLRDLKARNWSGYMTLEPHLSVAGQFVGYTGPELFIKAVTALKQLLDQVGLPYR
jgi:sugar phosphate isomerase/epimerase